MTTKIKNGLSYEKNGLTFLHDAELAGLKVIKSSAKNEVRRFSNPVLIDFVNALVPFEKYDFLFRIREPYPCAWHCLIK
jgi:hypothetical protein